MDAIHPLEHVLRWFPDDTCRVALDLGGGSGSSALHLARALPKATIYSFECDPRALEACRSALARTSVEVVPLAVAAHDGELSVYCSRSNAGTTSSLPRSDGADAPPLLVACARLDTWCAAHHIIPDLVWCDIEGDSLAALQGLGDLLHRVKGVYLAVHYKAIYQGLPAFGTLDELLRRHGLNQVLHQQSLPGCWGYALYARGTRAAPSPRGDVEATTDLPFARGGVGDLLQYLSAAVEARHIRVYSHFGGAVDFFRPFGVAAHHVPFEANTAFLSYAQEGQELRREHFLLPELPNTPFAIRRRRRIFGLHPFGSGYSNTFAERFRAPSKWMAPLFVERLLERVLMPNDDVLVFCAPSETHHLPGTLGRFYSRATVVAHPNIWDSLGAVPLCDCVVAVDSAIKTMASMLRIPTVTMVGDFEEPFRDRHFLDPYVHAGVMRVIRYQTFSEAKADEAAQAAIELLGGSP